MPQIVDRASFRAAVADAHTRTESLVSKGGGGDLLRVRAQLSLIDATLRSSLSIDPEHAEGIDLGPLSVENPAWPRDYAALLQAIDYTMRRHAALGDGFARGRRGIVQVVSGRHVFRKAVVDVNDRMVIGGDDRADLVLSSASQQERTLAGRHLELWWDGVVAHVRSLTEERFELAGRLCWRGELQSGDTFVVGNTTLRFFAEALSPPREPTVPLGDQLAVRDRLAQAHAQGQLFAVLDAARSRRGLTLLEEAIEPHASLYEGERARGLDDVAPYLVQLAQSSGLFGRLLAEGWGRAWGIYVISSSSAKLVRRSLRRLLMVDADTQRDPLYFRFYDPRVMRRFAPLATARQKSEMLAEARAIVFEAEDGSAVSFAADEVPS